MTHTLQGVHKKGLCSLRFRIGPKMIGKVVVVQCLPKTAVFNFIVGDDDAIPLPDQPGLPRPLVLLRDTGDADDTKS